MPATLKVPAAVLAGFANLFREVIGMLTFLFLAKYQIVYGLIGEVLMGLFTSSFPDSISFGLSQVPVMT